MSFEHQFASTDLTDEISIALCGENVIGAVIHILPKGDKDNCLHIEISPSVIEEMHAWTTAFLYHPNLKERLHIDSSMNKKEFDKHLQDKVIKDLESLIADKEFREQKTYINISIDYEKVLVLKNISKIKKLTLSETINELIGEYIKNTNEQI